MENSAKGLFAIVGIVSGAWVFAASCTIEQVECERDSDCKGDRVCDDGDCHDPKATSSGNGSSSSSGPSGSGGSSGSGGPGGSSASGCQWHGCSSMAPEGAYDCDDGQGSRRILTCIGGEWHEVVDCATTQDSKGYPCKCYGGCGITSGLTSCQYAFNVCEGQEYPSGWTP